MSKCVEDLPSTDKLDIPRIPRRANSITQVHWDLPPQGRIKCNIDGPALGSPPKLACGVFPEHAVAPQRLLYCSLCICFAFKAEIMCFILAIESANSLGWLDLYSWNLIKVNLAKFPWQLQNRWLYIYVLLSQPQR